jgi:hypothetical protein
VAKTAMPTINVWKTGGKVSRRGMRRRVIRNVQRKVRKNV